MQLHENEEIRQRALLVAVDTGEYDAEASMAELYELAKPQERRWCPTLSKT